MTIDYLLFRESEFDTPIPFPFGDPLQAVPTFRFRCQIILVLLLLLLLRFPSLR